MPASGTQTILVVEDWPELKDLYTAILKRGGYNVISAWDGFEALEQARAAKPDLIFMHVHLDGIDGYETYRRLKNDAATKDIPVILNSATDSAFERALALQAGIEGYLVKPFAAGELLDMVDSALKRRRLGIH